MCSVPGTLDFATSRVPHCLVQTEATRGQDLLGTCSIVTLQSHSGVCLCRYNKPLMTKYQRAEEACQEQQRQIEAALASRKITKVRLGWCVEINAASCCRIGTCSAAGPMGDFCKKYFHIMQSWNDPRCPCSGASEAGLFAIVQQACC